MIPSQLKDGTWRFLLVRAQDKKAFEKNWETTANYPYDDRKLLAHIEKGGNYGVLPGEAHIIIETDTPELEALVEKNFPQTFTQRSPGHRTKQFFYNGKASQTWPLFDKSRPKERQNIGHVKWGGSYVVGPGSIHPNKGKYEVVDDVPISHITEEQILEVITPFLARRAARFERKEAGRLGVKDDFSILDLVSGLGLKEQSGGQLQGKHPIHGSTTGTNFSIDPKGNQWHCFRCNTGGGPWQLLAVLEQIIDCSEAIPGGLRGEQFKQTLEKAQERGLVKLPSIGNWKNYTPETYENEEVLYGKIRGIFETYLDTPDERYLDVMASTVLLSYRIKQFKTTPYPFLHGPKASGKTRALDLLNILCYHPIFSSSITPAAIYQAIEQFHPTLLIDEADKWGLNRNVVNDEVLEVSRVLNAGYRRGQKVLRASKEGGALKNYDIFGLKVIAGTETFPETLMDRCIPIEMQENTRDIQTFLPEEEVFDPVRRQLEAYYQHYSNGHATELSDPEELKQIIGNNRLTELFYPLVSIAPNQKAKDSLTSFATENVQKRRELMRLSDMGQVAESVITLWLLQNFPDFISVEDIATFYSNYPSSVKPEGRTRWIGHKLTKLGLEGDRIGKGGIKGRIMDPERLTRMDSQYFVHYLTSPPKNATIATIATREGENARLGVDGVEGGDVTGLRGASNTSTNLSNYYEQPENR